MPVYEALVFKDEDYAAPCGVTFTATNHTHKKDDEASWATKSEFLSLIPRDKYLVMVLIQARAHREWNSKNKQYDFKPAEDCLISAWTIHRKLGNPYKPGTVLTRWFGGVEPRLRLAAGDIGDDLNREWDCHERTAQLSRLGVVHMLDFNLKNYKEKEAINRTVDGFADGQKNGWRGGTFPRLDGTYKSPSIFRKVFG